jgi:hypothetical protein
MVCAVFAAATGLQTAKKIIMTGFLHFLSNSGTGVVIYLLKALSLKGSLPFKGPSIAENRLE